ncbi:MAG TPA: ribonuclease HI [Blastocatellia bacterium]|nr:ribonuclease HI [Blastocatellia bacterium]
MNQSQDVIAYTDGACLGNPGPGGWGVVLLYGDNRKELSGGFRLTTNNRMEITAVIEALRALKRPCRITVHSDSQYVVNAIMQGWAERWRENGWKRNKKEKAINPDLWAELLELVSRHTVRLQWVRGHSGVEENERADRLAMAAAQRKDLPRDEQYERS